MAGTCTPAGSKPPARSARQAYPTQYQLFAAAPAFRRKVTAESIRAVAVSGVHRLRMEWRAVMRTATAVCTAVASVASLVSPSG